MTKVSKDERPGGTTADAASRFPARLLDGQEGGVQVLAAFLLVVLAGFAALSLDLGRAYAERQHLQNVADASALAGSRYLPDQDQAASAALDLAAINGVRREAVTVEFPTPRRISVRVARHLPYLLAAVLGVGGADVAATAEVRRGGVADLSGGDPRLGPDGCRTGDAEGDGEDSEDRDNPDDGAGEESGHGDAGHGKDGHDHGRQEGESGHGDGLHEGDGGDENGGGHREGDGGDDSGNGHHERSDTDGAGGGDGGDLPECGGSDGGSHGGENGSGDDHDRDGGTGEGHGPGDASRGGEDGGVWGSNGMAPLAVERTVVEGLLPGDLALLTVGPGDQTRGNFHALALGARGARVYERNLSYGFPGLVRVGDVVTTETGDIAGPTDRAIRRRMDADPGANWETVRPGSPRLLYVGVIDGLDGATGRDRVTIRGFAAFFLEECGGSDPGTVCGRFVRWVMPGQAGGGDFGFDAVQIVR